MCCLNSTHSQRLAAKRAFGIDSSKATAQLTGRASPESDLLSRLAFPLPAGPRESGPGISFIQAPHATRGLVTFLLQDSSSELDPSSASRAPSFDPIVKSPSVSRTALASGAAYLIAIAISFVQAPFLIRLLGDERYGIWTLIGQVTGYYGLLDMGTRGAIGYFVAQARARNEKAELAEITATAFWFLATAAMVVLAIGSVVFFLFPDIFKIEPLLRSQSLAALKIGRAHV